MTSVPKAPSCLASDGKREWKRVAPILMERRTLTDADLGTLEAYCVAFSRMRESERKIKREGLTITLAKGVCRHPAVAIQDAALKSMRQLAAELGLTPISRRKPATRDDDGSDDSADLGL